MSLRSRAREIVLQLLYQDDLNKDRATDEDMAFIKNRLHNNGNITAFAKELLDGVRAKSDEIDAELGRVATNWKLSRMAATDRNVLRLGAFEILFHDTPGKVAVNEAIELAKRYGNENSSIFINGILDRLIQATGQSPEEVTDAEPPENAETEPASDPPVSESGPSLTIADIMNAKRIQK